MESKLDLQHKANTQLRAIVCTLVANFFSIHANLKIHCLNIFCAIGSVISVLKLAFLAHLSHSKSEEYLVQHLSTLEGFHAALQSLYDRQQLLDGHSDTQVVICLAPFTEYMPLAYFVPVRPSPLHHVPLVHDQNSSL